MQVHIQKWKMEDAEKLQQLCDQADRRYLSDRLPHPYTLQNATEWIQYALQQEKTQKGIFRSIVVHHHIVGNISIERKEDVRCLEGEIGFLLDKTYWSNSITSKAVDLICKEAYKRASFTAHIRFGLCSKHRLKKSLRKKSIRLRRHSTKSNL